MKASSKPTVWDGDGSCCSISISSSLVPSPPRGMVTLFLLLVQSQILSVLSPPCGMATSVAGIYLRGLVCLLVLSPLGGMVTIVAYTDSLEADYVLSPPCGIETAETPRECLQLGGCSEPTVWDGDLKGYPVASISHSPCSKPTVWDGDNIRNLCPASATTRLEPTAWDGDGQGYEGSLQFRR